MHEFLMAKHGIPLEPVSDTQTKITYAKLFERFHKVAGMTGTARESANSFWEHYRLSVRPKPHLKLFSSGEFSTAGQLELPESTYVTYHMFDLLRSLHGSSEA